MSATGRDQHWYCCYCGHGGWGGLDAHCHQCGHQSCPSCTTDATNALTTYRSPPLAVAPTPNLPAVRFKHDHQAYPDDTHPPAPAPLPDQMHPEHTHTTRPNTPDYPGQRAHGDKGPSDGGEVEYHFYCCYCKSGPYNVDLYGHCTVGCGHRRCQRCPVEAHYK